MKLVHFYQLFSLPHYLCQAFNGSMKLTCALTLAWQLVPARTDIYHIPSMPFGLYVWKGFHIEGARQLLTRSCYHDAGS
jgi:hypothetical protein